MADMNSDPMQQDSNRIQFKQDMHIRISKAKISVMRSK